MVFQPDDPFRQIEQATLIISRDRVEANVNRIMQKTRRHLIRFRPHFKTHQDLEVGGWIRQLGITTITVSSLDMAERFHADGWDDITIAIPLNMRQLGRLERLAASCQLHLVVDHPQSLESLKELRSTIHVWIELDTGSGRTGIPVSNIQLISRMWAIGQSWPHVIMEGLLWHDGHFYHRSRSEVVASWQRQMERIQNVQDQLTGIGPRPALSAGDTPSSVFIEDLSGLDEIRAGNLVYFDLMQAKAGVCDINQIAVILAAPVIGHYPDRDQIAIHAGAVHLSKDSLSVGQHPQIFGRLVHLTPKGWSVPPVERWVTHISQEHGLVNIPAEEMDLYPIGSLVGILPVHSCLTADAMKGHPSLYM